MGGQIDRNKNKKGRQIENRQVDIRTTKIDRWKDRQLDIRITKIDRWKDRQIDSYINDNMGRYDHNNKIYRQIYEQKIRQIDKVMPNYDLVIFSLLCAATLKNYWKLL